MNLFDTDSTYDILSFDRINQTIKELISDHFKGHFPSLWSLWLIERYCPNQKAWADDWVALAYDFLTPLTRTHLLFNSEINGATFGFEPVYTANLLDTLRFENVPDTVILMVHAGKTVTITWIERSHEIAEGYYCPEVNNQITCWHREERTYTATGENDLQIVLNSEFWLINSVVITGDGVFIGLTNAQKELLLYEFLGQTLGEIVNQLELSDCAVLTAFDVNYTFQVAYNDFYSHYPRQYSPTYSNPLFQTVPDWYHFAALDYATKNPWGTVSPLVNRGKKLIVREYLTVMLAVMRDYAPNQLAVPSNLANQTGSYHYQITKEVPNLYNFAIAFDYYLSYPFLGVGTGLLKTAQERKELESGAVILSFPTSTPPTPDYCVRRFQEGSNYWFYETGLFPGGAMDDSLKPLFTRCDVSYHNIRYADCDPSFYTDLFQSREILLNFLCVMDETRQEKSDFRDPPNWTSGFASANVQDLAFKSSFLNSYLKLTVSLSEEGEMTPSFSVATLEDRKVEKYSRREQGSGFWYQKYLLDDPSVSISLTETGQSNWMESGNKTFRIKREFWTAEPQYKDSEFTDLQLTSIADLLDPTPDNIMPDSQRVKDIDFRLKLLNDWMGIAEQPDGTLYEYPDPYHHDDLTQLQGYQFASFTKPSNEANRAAIYEVITNRTNVNAFGEKEILQGGFVKTFSFPQMIEQFFFDIAKGLGLQEAGGIQITKGDNSGIVTYESQLAIAIDTLRTLSSLSKQINELVIQAARQQVLSQSILAATGVRISTQHIPFTVNDQTLYAEVACIAPGSPSLMDEILTLQFNTSFLIGGNIAIQEVTE